MTFIKASLNKYACLKVGINVFKSDMFFSLPKYYN